MATLEDKLISQLTEDQTERLLKSADQINGAIAVFSVERNLVNYSAFDAVFADYDDDLAFGEPATPTGTDLCLT